MNPYASHLPLLYALVTGTTGPVLELGMGDGSTPFLHDLCSRNKRTLLSVDATLEWAAGYGHLATDWHEVRCVPNYDDCAEIDRPGWVVAFLDHAPAGRRVVDIRRLADKARFLVVHDTESGEYGYEEVLPSFPFRFDDKGGGPWTTMVSRFAASPFTYTVFVNNRNRLTSLRKMVDYLVGLGGVQIAVVDNASTWPPLLEWYEQNPWLRVIHLGYNGGPQAPFEVLRQALPSPYYAVTDSDLDLGGVPADLLDVLRRGLDAHSEILKVGLSLETDDLPRTRLGDAARQHEARFWQDRLDGAWWKADVDTAFALYRAGEGWGGYGPSLRADRPYTARHLPWYATAENLTDEDRYYAEHCEGNYSFWRGGTPWL